MTATTTATTNKQYTNGAEKGIGCLNSGSRYSREEYEENGREPLGQGRKGASTVSEPPPTLDELKKNYRPGEVVIEERSAIPDALRAAGYTCEQVWYEWHEVNCPFMLDEQGLRYRCLLPDGRVIVLAGTVLKWEEEYVSIGDGKYIPRREQHP